MEEQNIDVNIPKEEKSQNLNIIDNDNPNKIIIENDLIELDNSDPEQDPNIPIPIISNCGNNVSINQNNEIVYNLSDSIESNTSLKTKKLGKKINREYRCNELGCNKIFKDKSALKKHLIIHGEKLYVCEICKKKFLDNSKLRRHSLVHSGEKPFECHICFKKFSLDFNLRTHMRIHSGEKPYACVFPGCFKRFSQSSNLIAHEKVHELMKNNIKLEEMNYKPIFYENPLKYMIENPYSGTETMNNIYKINELYQIMKKGIEAQMSFYMQTNGNQLINKNQGDLPGMPFQKRQYIKKMNKENYNNFKKDKNINYNNNGVNLSEQNRKIFFKIRDGEIIDNIDDTYQNNSDKSKRQIFSTYKDPVEQAEQNNENSLFNNNIIDDNNDNLLEPTNFNNDINEISENPNIDIADIRVIEELLGEDYKINDIKEIEEPIRNENI